MSLTPPSPIASRADVLAIPRDVLLGGVIFGIFVEMDIGQIPGVNTFKFWTGAGDVAAGGKTWRGMGGLTEISNIPMGAQESATYVDVVLSGEIGPDIYSEIDDKFSRYALEFRDRIELRECSIFCGIIDPKRGNDPFVIPLFYLFRCLNMQAPEIAMSADGSSVAIRLDSIFSSNVLSRGFEYYTEQSQKAISPGDRGLEGVAALEQGVTVLWSTT